MQFLVQCLHASTYGGSLRMMELKLPHFYLIASLVNTQGHMAGELEQHKVQNRQQSHGVSQPEPEGRVGVHQQLAQNVDRNATGQDQTCTHPTSSMGFGNLSCAHSLSNRLCLEFTSPFILFGMHVYLLKGAYKNIMGITIIVLKLEPFWKKSCHIKHVKVLHKILNDMKT